ncbi:MAG: hypothetical protein LDL27_05760 [Desulfovibrio sp.]|nr:hypothetical protein [Desulfovibrio sp.]
MEWIVLGVYTLVLVGVFLVAHRRSVEGYQRVLKHWELKCQRLIHDNEVLQQRIEERNLTVEFLKERLAEAELIHQETCGEVTKL